MIQRLGICTTGHSVGDCIKAH